MAIYLKDIHGRLDRAWKHMQNFSRQATRFINTITRAWTMMAAEAGVKLIHLHDARHTHASLMLKQGVHPKIVQERLGHATIQMTLDTYSHVAPGLQEAAAVGFDKILFPRREKETIENN
jgi:integrase